MQILSAQRSHEKGKPSERMGRKATGLSPDQLRIWQQGCRGDRYLPGTDPHTASVSVGGARCSKEPNV